MIIGNIYKSYIDSIKIASICSANSSDLLITLLRSVFATGDEKFSWSELTEAKNPKNKKNTKKISFIKGTPFGRSGKRGVVIG